MPLITSYSGRVLLDKSTVEDIKNQTDILLQNKDVAQAWQAVRHLKKELSALPVAEVQAVLPDYRRVSANLKVLAMSFLEPDEVFGLFENNFDFLKAMDADLLSANTRAWFSCQDEQTAPDFKNRILKSIPPTEALRPKLERALAESPSGAPAAAVAAAASQKPALVIKGGPDEMLDEHEATELIKHQDKVTDIGGAPLPVDEATGLAENIFSQMGAVQDKETFLRRAHALILSRLRDVRTTAGLREYLERPFAVGGLGLSSEALDKASAQIEQAYNKLHTVAARPLPPPAPIAPPEPKPEPVPEPPKPVEPAPAPLPVVAPEPAKVVVQPELPPVPVVPAPPQNTGPLPPPPLPLAPAPSVTPSIPEGLARIATQSVASGPRIMRPQRVSSPDDKPRVDDVKFGVKQGAMAATHSLDAAEELKLMTVEDWRRFGGASGGTAELLRRVELLKQESAMSRLQGIKYLRASELWQQYLKIGQASLTQGKKLGEVLADATINSATLTEDEFFSISSLNSKLK